MSYIPLSSFKNLVRRLSGSASRAERTRRVACNSALLTGAILTSTEGMLPVFAVAGGSAGLTDCTAGRNTGVSSSETSSKIAILLNLLKTREERKMRIQVEVTISSYG